MPSVLLHQLSRHFGEATAVDRVSLSIEHGEFVTLLGPSGCGKTTTLRMVAGLEQNDGGRIAIADQVVSDPVAGIFVPPDRRKLGMVFQSYAIWPHMTVFDNVAYPLQVRHTSPAVVRERVMAALRLVEMDAFSERPAPALSGGQQQRVAIARAIVFEPEVMLLDEPLSNLDAKLRAQMGEEFRALQRRLGITTLYVTHDQEEAMALSDRIVVMQRGRILQIGTPESIYQRPASRDVAAFFGFPNFLEARVESVARVGDEYRLGVCGSGWTGECMSKDEQRIGSQVSVMIRPENIRIAENGVAKEAGEMSWSGKVIDCSFHGARRLLRVASDTLTWHVETSAMRSAKTGDHVRLIATPNCAWALSAD